MKRVYNAADIIEANIIKGMLEHNDIAAHVGGYYLQGGVGELPAAGNASVWVEDEDVERAERIILQYDASKLRDIRREGASGFSLQEQKVFVVIVIFIVLLFLLAVYLEGN